MKFMVLLKACKDTEAGKLPSEELIAKMTAYNEELVNAGVLVAGEGLHPSAKGARVLFDGDKRSVVDGPFSETKELIAGFWIFQTGSLEEAIDWVKKCPQPMEGPQAQIEIRKIFEAEDFGEAFTPELQAREDALRQKLGQGD